MPLFALAGGCLPWVLGADGAWNPPERTGLKGSSFVTRFLMDVLPKVWGLQLPIGRALATMPPVKWAPAMTAHAKNDRP